MKKILIAILLFAALAFTASFAAELTVPELRTSQPWLASMARFLVGSTAKVRSLRVWTPTGDLRRDRGAAGDFDVIALDPIDASDAGVSTVSLKTHVLYESFPLRKPDRASALFDPSALPFISQRLLVTLAELMPENYTFYQRRLAEFQSRLESTLEIGRSLIGQAKILDLTGAVGPWVRAASSAVRPSAEQWSAWSGSTRTPELRELLDASRAAGRLIVLDVWTPEIVRKIAEPETFKIMIVPPADQDADPFSYLHDIYIDIWKKTSAN